jgi:hypothetical protein
MEGTMRLGAGFYKFKSGIELFRNEISTELPLQHLYMILLTAEHEEVNQQDFQKMLGAPGGTVSRNLKKLSIKIEHDKDVGYGILDVRPHPLGMKCFRCSLLYQEF